MPIRKLVNIILSLCAIVLLGYAIKDPAQKLLRANHLLPEPEPLTELYFEDHTTLPTSFKPGDTQTIRYTIYNIEYKPMFYDIEITAKTASASTVIAKQSIGVPHNESLTLTQHYTLSEATRTAVMVKLDSGQAIHLWMDPAK